jgi:hypothetical protein
MCFQKIYFSLKIERTPTILLKIASWRKKLTETPYLLVVTLYSGSAILNGPVCEFLRVFKIQNFPQNRHVLSYSFTEKHQFSAKIGQNSVFVHCDPHILDHLYLMVAYISFYGFFKKIIFSLKFHRC